MNDLEPLGASAGDRARLRRGRVPFPLVLGLALSLMLLAVLAVVLAYVVHPFSQPIIDSTSIVTPVRRGPRPVAPAIEPVETPQEAHARITVPEGFVTALWAAEPLVMDPVSFCFDEQGRMYVTESFRKDRGVEDNRENVFWLLDDLSSQTIEDRRAMYVKWADQRPGKMAYYRQYEDRIRRLEDTDGDGTADTVTIYAEGFNGTLDGLGSGVLAHDGVVWYTCIPSLWRLEDVDDDGRAERRDEVHRGFGVRIALGGHDLHGLTWGPDGRLYWSMGDRGYHVETTEGRVLHSPGSGAVLRCEPDGSNLEVFHHGLRNPQELAFDDLGNLFTGDNNSDGGDKARLVYCVEGGETGWQMEYQTLEGDNLRGPWMQERMWEPRNPDQPAWILPPVANLASGPSGLAFDPGDVLPEPFRGHFLLCDFRGAATHSRLLAFSVKSDGAGFALADERVFVDKVLCTDVAFGWDGRIYMTDWGHGWDSTGDGRVHVAWEPAMVEAPGTLEVGRLVRAGFHDLSSPRLIDLLSHDDQRIRRRAQFELVDRGVAELPRLWAIAKDGTQRRTRVHAIWALGTIARRLDIMNHVHPLDPLIELLVDPDSEIRAQVARVIGDGGYSVGINWEWLPMLMTLLEDPSPRVRFFAAIALGNLRCDDAIDPLLDLVRRNADEDLYLRHAAVVALHRINRIDDVLARAEDPDEAVLRAVVLVLRRAADPRIASFLDHTSIDLAAEAACAINDVPIPEALPALADSIDRCRSDRLLDEYGVIPPRASALLRRAINSCLRLGDPQRVENVLGIMVDRGLPEVLRREAAAALVDWQAPSLRDRVDGVVRPIPPDPTRLASLMTVLLKALPEIAIDADAVSLAGALRLSERYDIPFDDETSRGLVVDDSIPVRLRSQALRHLVQRDAPGLEPLLNTTLDASAPLLRATARAGWHRVSPDRGLELLEQVLNDPGVEVLERQHAVAVLGDASDDDTASLLLTLAQSLNSATLDPTLHLDVLGAARQRGGEDLSVEIARWNESLDPSNPVAPFLPALEGGDSDNGRRLFRNHGAAQCIRCHAIDDEGGIAGPDLAGIASKRSSLEMLTSLITPNETVAEGFGDYSPMPPMSELLTTTDLRDIIAYLQELTGSTND